MSLFNQAPPQQNIAAPAGNGFGAPTPQAAANAFQGLGGLNFGAPAASAVPFPAQQQQQQQQQQMYGAPPFGMVGMGGGFPAAQPPMKPAAAVGFAAGFPPQQQQGFMQAQQQHHQQGFMQAQPQQPSPGFGGFVSAQQPQPHQQPQQQQQQQRFGVATPAAQPAAQSAIPAMGWANFQ